MVQLGQHLAADRQSDRGRRAHDVRRVRRRAHGLQPERRLARIERRRDPQRELDRRHGRSRTPAQIEGLEQAPGRHVAGFDQRHDQHQQQARAQRPGIEPRQLRARRPDPQPAQRAREALLVTLPERAGRRIVVAAGQLVAERAQGLVRERVDLLEPAQAGGLVGPARRRRASATGSAPGAAASATRASPCSQPGSSAQSPSRLTIRNSPTSARLGQSAVHAASKAAAARAKTTRRRKPKLRLGSASRMPALLANLPLRAPRRTTPTRAADAHRRTASPARCAA